MLLLGSDSHNTTSRKCELEKACAIAKHLLGKEEYQEMINADSGQIGEATDIATFVRFVSRVSDGDEYLVLGSALADSVGEETITEIFETNRKNAIDEIVNIACDSGNLFTLTASKITVIKHMLPVYLWGGAFVLLILAIIALCILA